jgi:putative alpha-1,2-mannosidase
MGFYPVNPVSGNYEMSSSVFDRVTIKVAKNKTFKITMHKSTEEAKYISTMKLNGKPYVKTYLQYADIMKGGTLEVYLESRHSPVSK